MKVYNQLNNDLIFLNLSSEGKENLLKEMVAGLKEKGYISNEKKILNKLLEREHLCSTALEKGIAVPHALVDLKKPPLVALGLLRNGVDFESADRMPTHVVILLLGSKDDPGSHLRLLAHICRLVKETKFVERTRRVKTASEAMTVFKEEEEKI